MWIIVPLLQHLRACPYGQSTQGTQKSSPRESDAPTLTTTVAAAMTKTNAMSAHQEEIPEVGHDLLYRGAELRPVTAVATAEVLCSPPTI